MKLKNYKYLIDNFIGGANNFKEIYIYLLITFCSIKLFGYAFGFLLLVPFLFINFKNFVSYLQFYIFL